MKLTRVCKRCSLPFEQVRIQGRPTEFCGARCKYEARREAHTKVTAKRYSALRAAGVPAIVAQPASCSRWRFEVLMREVAQ